MPNFEALTELLEQSGLPTSEALEIARDLSVNIAQVRPPLEIGGTHADVLPELWQRARASGAKSLTVKLEVEEDGYHTRIAILERTERHALERSP
jgi:hypothetical protein